MAVGDPFNGGDRDSAEDMVFIPSSLPLVSSINLDSLMAHFDDNVYDKSPTSHLRHIIEVLCGKSGFGGLLYKSVRDWLNGGVETAWLGSTGCDSDGCVYQWGNGTVLCRQW
jgi:hypothetical protein